MKVIYAAILASLIAFPAFALDLQEARAKGVLGELNTGYVKVLAESAEASKLADEVNAKRKAEYARISKENGQPVDVVAKLAAGQIIGNLPGGAQYQDASGNWKKR